MTEAVGTLKAWVEESSRVVFFGGAGVSTESGIPDFRSTGGLYHQEWKYPPETILSHTFYKSNPEEFFRFYRAKLLAPEARPNAAHKKLAELEAAGKLDKTLIVATGDHIPYFNVDTLEELMPAAMDKARELCKRGPLVLRYLKACMNEQEDCQVHRKKEMEVPYTR